MNLYTFTTLITSITFFILGNIIGLNNKGSKPHKVYARAFYIVGVSILAIYLFTRANSEKEAWIWLRFSAVMHFIAPLSLQAILYMISGIQKKHTHKRLLFIYTPFVLFFLQDLLFPGLTFGNLKLTSLGWANTFKTDSVFFRINQVSYIFYVAVLMVLIIYALRTTRNKPIKKFVYFFLYTYFIPLFAAVIILFIIPEYLRTILRFEAIAAFFAAIITTYGILTTNIFDFNIDIVSKDIIKHMPNFLVLTDKKRSIIDVNTNTINLSGYAKNELINNPVSLILDEKGGGDVFSLENINSGVEIKLKTKGNKRIPALVSASRIALKGEFLGYVLIGSDIRNVHHLQTEKKIIEMELKALVAQMNPHFLFNALNSIQHFLLHDFRKANHYLSNLATLLRKILENSNKSLISVNEEINILKLYLDIESLRFGEEFEYNFEVKESIDIFDRKIPPMLVQPFVENAIWHGLRPSSKKTRRLNLRIDEPDEERLCITIEDNGVGINNAKNKKGAPDKEKTSHSISNIKERIRLINNQAGHNKILLSITDIKGASGSGTRVELSFIENVF